MLAVCRKARKTRMARTTKATRSSKPRAEDTFGDVGRVGVSRRGRRLVEYGQLVDPVEAEQPDVLRATAPGLEIPDGLHEKQPHRVDGALGDLVFRSGVVADPQCPARLQGRGNLLADAGGALAFAHPAADDDTRGQKLPGR